MNSLTAEARSIAADIASRHGVSTDAVTVLMVAVAQGQGMQAQFNHPELGGMGQWSRGGMTMVGDMFNNGLRARVDALCTEISQVTAERQIFEPAPNPSGAQSYSASQSQGQSSGGNSFYVSSSSSSSWPDALGHPSSTGSQNSMRYGVFPDQRRLAVEVNGAMQVFDTGDHRISGVSQQQGGDQSLTFIGQHGLVKLSELKKVDLDAAATDRTTEPAHSPQSRPPETEQSPAPAPDNRPSGGPTPDSDGIIALIQKLADLKANGILTEDEFQTKKSELLSRL